MSLTKKNIDELYKENLISEAQSAEIIKYIEQKSGKFNLTLLLPMIGMFLVGSGVIAIGAYNWYYIPIYLKLLIAILPMLALLTLFYKKEKDINNNGNEMYTFGIGISILFAIGIIAQTLQIPIELNELFRISPLQ